MSNITAVFVYGSLKQGQYNYPVACRAGQHTVTPASLGGHQLHDLGPFPAVVTGQGTVYGQVLDYGHDISRALFQLDGLEGFRGFGNPHNHYDRAEVTATLEDGTTVPCWVYLYARNLERAGVRHLPAGHWPQTAGAL